MTTVIDVANRALLAAGIQKKISSLNQDSAEAQAIALVIDNIRQDLLRMAPWNFAVCADNLVLMFAAPGTPENTNPATPNWVPGQPLPPWLYEYVYPADCLRAFYLTNTAQSSGFSGIPITTAVTGSGPAYINGPAATFKVQNDKYATGGPQRVLLTNQENATLYYIQDVQNPVEMDSMFISAWRTVLAATITMALSGDKTLANMLIQQANKVIAEARSPDGNEGLTIDDRTPDWIRTRGWGADATYSGSWSGVNWGGLWASW